MATSVCSRSLYHLVTGGYYPSTPYQVTNIVRLAIGEARNRA